MNFLELLKGFLKAILDFFYGKGSELSDSEKQRDFSLHRPYRFIRRLRAKPQLPKEFNNKPNWKNGTPKKQWKK